MWETGIQTYYSTQRMSEALTKIPGCMHTQWTIAFVSANPELNAFSDAAFNINWL